MYNTRVMTAVIIALAQLGQSLPSRRLSSQSSRLSARDACDGLDCGARGICFVSETGAPACITSPFDPADPSKDRKRATNEPNIGARNPFSLRDDGNEGLQERQNSCNCDMGMLCVGGQCQPLLGVGPGSEMPQRRDDGDNQPPTQGAQGSDGRPDKRQDNGDGQPATEGAQGYDGFFDKRQKDYCGCLPGQVCTEGGGCVDIIG